LFALNDEDATTQEKPNLNLRILLMKTEESIDVIIRIKNSQLLKEWSESVLAEIKMNRLY
jgi:hypothetical protein